MSGRVKKLRHSGPIRKLVETFRKRNINPAHAAGVICSGHGPHAYYGQHQHA